MDKIAAYPEKGLTIILLSDDILRNDGAIMMAMAHAALHDESEARTRIFFHAPVVARLAQKDDDLLAEAQALGIILLACQTGLAVLDIAADRLGYGATASGPIALFNDLDDDRLVMV